MKKSLKKPMLIGSVSVASVVLVVMGSMAPSLIMSLFPEEAEIIKELKIWDIVVPDDYNTIYEAVENAKSGDQIFVRQGSYNSGTGMFSRSLMIRTPNIGIYGEDKNNTIIDGCYQSTVIAIYADNVKIDGFTIRNNGLNSSLLSVFSDNNKIENNIFKTHDVYDGIEYGIRFINSHYNFFSNNSISGGEYGIKLSNADYNFFSNNTIEHTDFAVDFDPMIMINISNSITNILYPDQSCYNTFIDNKIKNNRYGISLSYSVENVFINNTFISNNKNGLSITSCKNNIIKNNRFIKDGLQLFGSKLDHFIHTIEGNTVNDKPLYYIYQENDIEISGDAGQIIIVDSRYITIKNVKIFDTHTAVIVAFSFSIFIIDSEFSNNYQGVFLYRSTRCSISRNNFIKNNRNAFFINEGFSNARSNFWSRNYWEKKIDLRLAFIKAIREKIYGRMILKRPFRIFDPLRIGIRIKNVDRNPARYPYDI